MSSFINWRETFSFIFNYPSPKSEITANKTFDLQEECWNLWYCVRPSHSIAASASVLGGIGTSPSLKIYAKLSPIKQEGVSVSYGTNVSYCEIKIRFPNQANVLSQSRKNIDYVSNKFEFDIVVQGCVSSSYEISFILGYNSPRMKASILTSMWKMQKDGILADFVIKTKDADIPCHKVVLAACSDPLRGMCTTQMKETIENVLHWENVFDSTTVQDLLHFMYTGEKPPNITKSCFSLVEAANMCLLEVLKEMCVDEIVPKVNADNVVEVLVMGEKYNSETLKKTAFNFMVKNFDFSNGDVSQLKGWDQMEPEMGKSLLASFINIIGIKKINL